MKNSILTFLLLLSTNAFADVKIEMEGKEYGCDKSSEEVFHCVSKGKKILVIKNFMGYMAYEKKGDDIPAMKWLSKVSDGIKVLYEVPKYPGMGMGGLGTGTGMGMGTGQEYGTGIGTREKNQSSEDQVAQFAGGFGGGVYGGGMMGGFTPPESKSGKLMAAKGILHNLKEVDDEWARDFIDQSQKFIDDQKAAKSKAKIVSNGKTYSCTRGEDKALTKEEEQVQSLYNIKIQCDYFACTSPSGEKLLGFIPEAGTFSSPYVVSLNGTNSVFQTDNFKIFDNEKGQGVPLYDVPKIPTDRMVGMYGYQEESELTEKLFVPEKFEKDINTFNYFTNPAAAAQRDEAHKHCTGENEASKFLAEEKKTADLFQNEVVTMELGHYVTMLNGQMISMVVDANKGRKLGCSYDDMILSQKAREHLEYLQKAKPKPVNKFLSEDEVQDLFKKAKSMDDIPFGYAYDGCYARAHVMARRFEAMGIPAEKAWIKGSLFIPGTDIQWNYHVAPVVNVKTKSGEIVKYVIDPSINDKAVPVDGWVATMGKNVKGDVVKTSYPFPVNIANFQRTAVAISSSDIYVPDNDEKRSEEENMAMAIQTMKEYSAVLKANGKGI